MSTIAIFHHPDDRSVAETLAAGLAKWGVSAELTRAQSDVRAESCVLPLWTGRAAVAPEFIAALSALSAPRRIDIGIDDAPVPVSQPVRLREWSARGTGDPGWGAFIEQVNRAVYGNPQAKAVAPPAPRSVSPEPSSAPFVPAAPKAQPPIKAVPAPSAEQTMPSPVEDNEALDEVAIVPGLWQAAPWAVWGATLFTCAAFLLGPVLGASSIGTVFLSDNVAGTLSAGRVMSSEKTLDVFGPLFWLTPLAVLPILMWLRRQRRIGLLAVVIFALLFTAVHHAAMIVAFYGTMFAATSIQHVDDMKALSIGLGAGGLFGGLASGMLLIAHRALRSASAIRRALAALPVLTLAAAGASIFGDDSRVTALALYPLWQTLFGLMIAWMLLTPPAERT